MIYDLEDKKREEVRAGQSCLRSRQAIPQCLARDGVFVRKTQNTVLGICGILVFWYSGLAPRKTRFWDTGTVCIWHVARGGLDFWGKNEGDEGGQPAMEQDKPIVQNKANSREV